jgi:NitT/TauT family transport system ATP-binding protein
VSCTDRRHSAIVGPARTTSSPRYGQSGNSLNSTKDGNLGEGFFLDLLRRGFSEDEARQQLRIAIDWGRYGELFDFDANSGQLALDHAPAPAGI